MDFLEGQSELTGPNVSTVSRPHMSGDTNDISSQFNSSLASTQMIRLTAGNVTKDGQLVETMGSQSVTSEFVNLMNPS